VRSEIEWALRSLGPAAELVRARQMHNNGHVALHKLDVNHRGVRRRLVMRRYIDEEWVTSEPDLASREAKTLTLLEGVPELRTPKLVAVDATGREAGVPTVLMTHLGGREEWKPPSIEKFAEIAPRIHEVRAPRNFRRYRRYYTGDALVVPRWTKQPKLWERAFEVAEAARVDEATACFIHRDHHAGNVLWSYGRIVGVIDWEPACIGPPAVDYAHVRVNLAAWMGISAARRYAKRPGIEVDPVWDIVDACDLDDLPGPHSRRGQEAFVADALSELG
jgi:aminoglycoside phosphotransferase (APT) family kinase protein